MGETKSDLGSAYSSTGEDVFGLPKRDDLPSTIFISSKHKKVKRTLIYFTMDTQYQSFCFRFFSSSSLVDKFADNPFLQVGVFCFLFFNGLRLNSLLWSGHRARNCLAVRRRITDSRPSKFMGRFTTSFLRQLPL